MTLPKPIAEAAAFIERRAVTPTNQPVHLGSGECGEVQGHTPGPWEFREWMHSAEELSQIRAHQAAGLSIEPVPLVMNDGARCVMAAQGRVALVDCQTAFKRGHGHKADCAERDANARLIAAAPELLEVLENLLRVTYALSEAANLSMADEEMDKAREVIAKATGATK